MCGRFALYASAEELEDTFDIMLPEPVTARYNIAPGQQILAVRRDAEGRQGTALRWGLVPAWAKDPSIGYRLINARSESVTEKPAFRDAFRRRRCLIPASGFYEWTRDSRHQPYYFTPRAGRLCALAGLWAVWTSPENRVLESCTILTVDSNEPVSGIHPRMPVIIGGDDFDAWLLGGKEPAQALLTPAGSEVLEHHAVDKRVGKVEVDGPACIVVTPVPEPGDLSLPGF